MNDQKPTILTPPSHRTHRARLTVLPASEEQEQEARALGKGERRGGGGLSEARVESSSSSDDEERRRRRIYINEHHGHCRYVCGKERTRGLWRAFEG